MIFYPILILGYMFYIGGIAAISIYVDDNYIHN